MVSLPSAPDAILELVKCDSLKSNCTNLRCMCLRNKLKCTDLCGCNGEGDDGGCENMLNDDIELEEYRDDNDRE